MTALSERLTAQMTERFARFCELRDAGVREADAGNDIGVSATTARRYETAWRKQRGMPGVYEAYRTEVTRRYQR